MERAAALQALADVVGPGGVVADPQTAARYLTDERGLYRGRAAIVLRPGGTGEVARVVEICQRAGLGMVPQGGNTGYCGGATPDDSGREVLVSLERMNAVRAVDPVGFTITVEAGAVLADVQRAAAAQGRLFPLSMGSEGSCQIGGNLSTNAGGLAVLRYGTAGDLVLGLEVVLPDGRVLHGLKALRKDNTGYDLRHLFVGAEGTLGIITAATLELFPVPRERGTALLAVRHPAAACALLGRARELSGDALTGFEYLARPALESVIARVPGCSDPLESGYEHYVLAELSCAFEGEAESVFETLLGESDGGVLDGVLARSEAQREALWRLREAVPEAEKHLGGSIKHDVSVPIDRIPEFLERAPDVVRAVVAECRFSVYGHVGDGNLHFNVLAPSEGDAGFRHRHGEAVSAAVHALAADMDGSFSAEHGIGRLKRSALADHGQPEALEVMRALKRALDPRGLMNPGKVL